MIGVCVCVRACVRAGGHGWVRALSRCCDTHNYILLDWYCIILHIVRIVMVVFGWLFDFAFLSVSKMIGVSVCVCGRAGGSVGAWVSEWVRAWMSESVKPMLWYTQLYTSGLILYNFTQCDNCDGCFVWYCFFMCDKTLQFPVIGWIKYSVFWFLSNICHSVSTSLTKVSKHIVQ